MPDTNKSTVHKSLLKRLAVIDREIGCKRFPKKERLAQLLEVSEKTIQRDIDFMRFEYSAPIEFDKKRKGFYYSDIQYRLNPLKIDSGDLLALAITYKVLQQYSTSPYAKYFKKFYEKLSNLSEGKVSISAKDLDSIISFQIGPVRNMDEKIMDKITEALQENKRIRITYVTGYSGVQSEREIDIYHLKNHHGDWYIIGLCRKSGQVKVFAVSRIKAITLTNAFYDIPHDFSISEYFKDSFGIYESKEVHDVKLKIINDSVRYVREKQWHKSQKITELEDGSIFLEFRVNNLTEILMWVLSLGRDCEVIKPPIFKQLIIDELEHTIKNYK